MDSPGSDSENESYQTDDSEYNLIWSMSRQKSRKLLAVPLSQYGPYVDEPVADEEWLSKYRERKQSHDERLRILQNRLEGKEDVRNWLP